MKTESYTKPTEPFIMEDIRNSKYSILFNDLVNIQEETKTLDDGSIVPYYIYDIYKIEVWKRTNLKEDIKSNYKLWFEFARQ